MPDGSEGTCPPEVFLDPVDAANRLHEYGGVVSETDADVATGFLDVSAAPDEDAYPWTS